LAEFRIRGVATNIAFLQGVLADESFARGEVTTSFIDERPQLLNSYPSQDRGTKILSWLADVTVNQPYGVRGNLVSPALKLPALDLSTPILPGSRDLLLEVGAKRFAELLRADQKVAITDTTFRDAHQSLLATRVRTRDLVQIAPYQARLLPTLLSVEAWGGATYDVALRFLGEDPWERLEQLRKAMPNICLQMLLRGRNTVGYTPYPEIVTKSFVAEAASGGIDIFRIFDALNDISQMRPAIDAVLETGTAVAEVGICYTGDLLSPSEDLYTLDYYLKLAEQIAKSGAHIFAIKDMAGLLRPQAAVKLVSALRENFDLPVHLHTHDTAGGQLATLMAAIDAGVDAVDVASAPMAGTTSQPSASALIAALENTDRDPGIALSAMTMLEPYWEAVRNVYAPFESGLPGPTGRVYKHEIPGGQLSNLRQQAISLGLGNQFERVEDMYAAANQILGRPPKVTPSSKVVGDLALHLVAVNANPDDFEANPQNYDIPDSVVRFMAGELGDLPGGWPEPFRSKVLAGREIKLTETKLVQEDIEILESTDSKAKRQTLNRLLFPVPNAEFEKFRAQYSNLDPVETLDYLYGLESGHEHVVEIAKGVRLFIGLEAISNADTKGFRTVMTTLNGQLRPMLVRDRNVAVNVVSAVKANLNDAAEVAAPFAGVVTLLVAEGALVEPGQPVATIEAMKMEATITANMAGKVSKIAISKTQSVESGDLILIVSPN
ncbi:MAG: pyruvate carboxylase, partial [Actinobacteria bacterium]|nr:pyruvate carboxylase [Actinomycetota bacterium]